MSEFTHFIVVYSDATSGGALKLDEAVSDALRLYHFEEYSCEVEDCDNCGITITVQFLAEHDAEPFHELMTAGGFTVSRIRPVPCPKTKPGQA